MTIAEPAIAKNSHYFGDAQIERLFPLPLTVFEHYTLLDGETDAGLVFTLYIDVEGPINREAFEAAVAFATSRHPLFLATIVSSWWRKHWSLDRKHRTEIIWTRDGNVPAAWHQPPDLAREPGLAVLVQGGDGRARITARFHHACTDGVGAAQWLDDVMVHYANLTGDPDAVPAQNAIDLFRLMDRQRDRWPLSFGLRLIGQSIRNFFKHLFQLPRPLVASAEHCSDDAAPFDLVVHEFSTDDTATLRRLAKEKRVSLNAWLLCDLFRTIAIWNHAQDDRPSSNPWYRLCMPISLRERADAATPATNLVGLTFLQRRRTSLVGDRDQLLHSLEQECSDIKRLRRGTLFLRNLRLVCTVPGVLRLLLRLPVCYATMTLTNLGDPGRRLQSQFRRQDGKLLFGNLSIASFGGAPPLTGYLHGTISVNTYRDRLTLNLYMSPQRFTRADAARFMDIYVGELRAAVKPEQAASLQPLASPG